MRERGGKTSNKQRVGGREVCISQTDTGGGGGRRRCCVAPSSQETFSSLDSVKTEKRRAGVCRNVRVAV